MSTPPYDFDLTVHPAGSASSDAELARRLERFLLAPADRESSSLLGRLRWAGVTVVTGPGESGG